MSDLILKWYWRHRGLYVEQEDSIEAAVSSLRYAQEEGEASPSHIEVVSSDGAVRLIEAEELSAMIEAQELEAYKQYRATADTRPFVAKIVIDDGKDEAIWEWYRALADAEADAAKLGKRLGDRVRLVRL